MPTTVIVLLAVVMAAGIVAAVSATTLDGRQPFGRAWISARFENHPRIAHFFSERLDRSTAGGLLLTVGLLGVSAVAAAVTAVFDMVDGGYGLAGLDERVAGYGLAHGDAATFDIYRWFTHLGGTQVIVAVTLIVAAWGWWRYRNAHVALFMVTVTAGQALVNNGLKWMIDRDRPDLNQLASWSGSSFPSGHSAAAAATWAAVAVVLTLHSGKVARTVAAVIAAGIAAGVGATRALLGVHWFTDVVAGLTVGFGWFLVCTVVFGGRIMRFGEPREQASHPEDQVTFTERGA